MYSFIVGFSETTYHEDFQKKISVHGTRHLFSQGFELKEIFNVRTVNKV